MPGSPNAKLGTQNAKGAYSASRLAEARKGNRPSYIGAAPPPIAEPLYQQFVVMVAAELGQPVPTGIFGADMQVSLVNNGPVTIVLDSPA